MNELSDNQHHNIVKFAPNLQLKKLLESLFFEQLLNSRLGLPKATCLVWSVWNWGLRVVIGKCFSDPMVLDGF